MKAISSPDSCYFEENKSGNRENLPERVVVSDLDWSGNASGVPFPAPSRGHFCPFIRLIEQISVGLFPNTSVFQVFLP